MSEQFQDFEYQIIEHWHKLNEFSTQELDFLDAVLDWFDNHPKIDPEDVKFSDAFVNRIKTDADSRKLLKRTEIEERDILIGKSVNELEI